MIKSAYTSNLLGDLIDVTYIKHSTIGTHRTRSLVDRSSTSERNSKHLLKACNSRVINTFICENFSQFFILPTWMVTHIPNVKLMFLKVLNVNPFLNFGNWYYLIRSNNIWYLLLHTWPHVSTIVSMPNT